MVRPDPLGRVLERHRGKRADVLDGDLLQGVCGFRGRGSVPFRIGSRMEAVPVLHEERGPQYGVGQPAAGDMLLDLPFALKMRQPRLAVGADHRGIDKVLHTAGLGGVGQELALADFPVIPGLHEVLDRENAPDAFQRASHGGRIIQVAPEYFSARLGQGSGGGFGRITGQGPDGKTRLFQKMPRDGAALLAGGAGNQYQFSCSLNESFHVPRGSALDSVHL